MHFNNDPLEGLRSSQDSGLDRENNSLRAILYICLGNDNVHVATSQSFCMVFFHQLKLLNLSISLWVISCCFGVLNSLPLSKR